MAENNPNAIRNKDKEYEAEVRECLQDINQVLANIRIVGDDTDRAFADRIESMVKDSRDLRLFLYYFHQHVKSSGFFEGQKNFKKQFLTESAVSFFNPKIQS